MSFSPVRWVERWPFLTLGLATFLLFLAAETFAPARAAAQTVQVRGRVTERDSLVGVHAVSVRFAGTNHQAVTDSAGRFILDNVRPGTYTIELKRLGYADHNKLIDVPATSELRLVIRLDASPVGLPEITVTAISAEERARRAEGTASRLITFDAIQEAARTGRKFEDLIRSSGFGLRVQDGTFAADGDPALNILCIEVASRGNASFRRSGARGGGTGGGPRYPVCNMVPVFLDGLKLGNAGAYLRGVSLDMFERIEWLNSIAAGTRFGLQSENKGALVLHTRTGKR